MKYYLPVTAYEEKNCVWNHRQELGSLGRKAYIITGRHSAAANGSLDDVLEALKATGTDYEIFNEIEENPSVETVQKAVEKGKEAGIDFVIGIGGGSPMDAAKAIAWMMKHPQAGSAGLFDGSVDDARLPLAEIPTTCGTGSEVTSASILTRNDKQTKSSLAHKLFADYALMDASYLAKAPMQMLKNTSMDALAHLYESYVNSNATDFSRMFVSQGLSIWKKSKDVFLGKREAEEQDFRNMMTASCLAGMAIAHTGTSVPHGLSYILTYDLHMEHGRAVGYFQKGYLQEADPEERKFVLDASGFQDLDAFQEYYETTCGREEVPEQVLKRTYDAVLQDKARLAFAPYEIDAKKLARIAGME